MSCMRVNYVRVCGQWSGAIMGEWEKHYSASLFLSLSLSGDVYAAVECSLRDL